MEQEPFWPTVWKRLRPQALAAIIEFGEYTIIWASILAVHVIRVIVAAVGADPDVISKVAFMEKWFWISSFTAFFVRAALRIWRTPKV
jgi:hypothetical protein